MGKLESKWENILEYFEEKIAFPILTIIFIIGALRDLYLLLRFGNYESIKTRTFLCNFDLGESIVEYVRRTPDDWVGLHKVLSFVHKINLWLPDALGIVLLLYGCIGIPYWAITRLILLVFRITKS
jgi:hypothetical protein